MMSAAVIRIILLVSIAMGTGINQPQEGIYNENIDLLLASLDRINEGKMHKENNMEIQESIDENHPRDLNKLLEKFSDKKLEMDEMKEIEQYNSETEMVNKEHNILIKESKHPKQLSPTETIADKDHIMDENNNQKLLSMLNLDSDNDQENIPNLQVVLNSSVFVRGALRNILEKMLSNPQTLLDTPVADLEMPDVSTRIKFSKTSKTLEAMAELQASNEVQNAIAELQASNIVQQAINELRSSNAVQNALQELQKSPAIQQVITGLQSSNAVKKRLEEGLSSIQMIMTEASESVQKAITELQASNEVQNALAELQDSNIVQQAINELQSSNAVQNALQELQKSPAIQQVITGLQSSNAIKKRLEEGLSSIQMIMTEASEGVQKAIAEDPEVLQKALAGLQITNVQDAVEGLRAFSGAQETMDKTQTSNGVQEAMEELMALNAMDGAIVKAQDAAEFQKNMIQDFLSEARSAATLQDDIEELQNLEDIAITIDKTENESAIEKATLMDVDAHIANVQESMSKNKATNSVETVTSEKSDAEEPNDME